MVEPTLTKSGIALLVKGLSGSEIQFTKMKIGNGKSANTDISELTDLISPLLNIDIGSITRNDNNVVLNGNDYTNSSFTEDVTWNELGVYATDPDDGSEILFAVFNSSDDVELIPGNSSGVSVENKISAMLLISSDVSVSAVIKSIQYVTKEEFEAHTSETNPHGTTKSDVGLENVENLAISEQVPEFETGQTLSNISVGDTIKSIVSKLWSAINTLSAMKISAKTSDYSNQITINSPNHNFYHKMFYVKNGVAYINTVFCLGKKLSQDEMITILTLPIKMRPITEISVIGEASNHCPVSIGINSEGKIWLYSFGYEDMEKDTHIRFQATYPVE